MKKIILFLTFANCFLFQSCSDINQNQQELNNWLKIAKLPIIAKWQTTNPNHYDEDVILVDSTHSLLLLHECELSIPDTIKEVHDLQKIQINK